MSSIAKSMSLHVAEQTLPPRRSTSDFQFGLTSSVVGSAFELRSIGRVNAFAYSKETYAQCQPQNRLVHSAATAAAGRNFQAVCFD